MRRILRGIAVVLLIAGAAALLYYPITALLARYEKNQALEEFYQVAELAAESGEDGEEDTQSQANDEASQTLKRLLQDMQDYNQALYETGQDGLVDAWSYEQPVFTLEEYGIESEVAGYIEIPAMGETLPIYLGASKENMARGVAVLGQTSMPIGGENTNCVIAGHRGSGSEAVFREIQVLEPGDRIYITNFWEELVYEVESIQIIEPDDIGAVLIQEGRDMLTLISCHPYRVATHRYVVYCVRVDEEEEGASDTDSAADTAEENVDEELPEAESSGAELTEGENIEGENTEGELTEGEQQSQMIALLEKCLPIAGAVLFAVALILILLPQKSKRKKE